MAIYNLLRRFCKKVAQNFLNLSIFIEQSPCHVREKAYRIKNHTVGRKDENEYVSQKCISFDTCVPKVGQKIECATITRNDYACFLQTFLSSQRNGNGFL